jgi:hypothetical protein
MQKWTKEDWTSSHISGSLSSRPPLTSLSLPFFLSSAIEAILLMAQQANEMHSADVSSAILAMLAEFLDEDHSRLRLATGSTTHTGTGGSNEMPAEQSLDNLSKAVGL